MSQFHVWASPDNWFNERVRCLSYEFDKDANMWRTPDGLPVKTLRLGLLTVEMNQDHIVDHFSVHGAVKSVKIDKKHLSGFVTFFEAESVAKVLAIEIHTIAGHEIKVLFADSTHESTELELTQNVAVTSATKLLDLNDDCLAEIFSLEMISIMDLCAVARTSTRLRSIANGITTRNHSKCVLANLRVTKRGERRILVTFGSLISKLYIDYDVERMRLVDLLARCRDNVLETLNIYSCFKPSEMRCCLKIKLGAFKRLQNLQIHFCNLSGAVQNIFVDSESLTELEVCGKMKIKSTFPKLERFAYSAADCSEIGNFLPQHKNIKLLHITSLDDSSFLFPIIIDNCKQLENFKVSIKSEESIVGYESALQSLLTLEYLKKLQIHCGKRSASKFIQGLSTLKSLTSLALTAAVADSEFIPNLSQLKNLQELGLIDCLGLTNLNLLGDLTDLMVFSIYSRESIDLYSDLDLILLIKRLNNLQDLSFVVPFKMDKKHYLRIVDVVLGRKIGFSPTLKITCYTGDATAADLQYHGNNCARVKLRSLDNNLIQ